MTDKLNLTRRQLLGAAGLATVLPPAVLAQDYPGLPLNTPGVDHLDIIVPDVAASAAFYMQVFNTKLHVQSLQTGERYFILLGELNDKREVGYLAIGASRGRGSYIGHYCTSVYDWRRDRDTVFDSLGRAVSDAGLGTFPGSTGFGGIFSDPDGIEIQFLPAPDTLVTAAVPSDLVPANQGMVTPLGVDHVHLVVSDLDMALRYYRILYGPESEPAANGQAAFGFPASNTRLVLEQATYAYGQKSGIAHFGIKVMPFDKAALESRLADLGATVLPVAGNAAGVRFRDLDNIMVELIPI